jgi:hypothetical protein
VVALVVPLLVAQVVLVLVVLVGCVPQLEQQAVVGV